MTRGIVKLWNPAFSQIGWGDWAIYRLDILPRPSCSKRWKLKTHLLELRGCKYAVRSLFGAMLFLFKSYGACQMCVWLGSRWKLVFDCNAGLSYSYRVTYARTCLIRYGDTASGCEKVFLATWKKKSFYRAHFRLSQCHGVLFGKVSTFHGLKVVGTWVVKYDIMELCKLGWAMGLVQKKFFLQIKPAKNTENKS